MKKSEFYAKFDEFVKDWEGCDLTASNQFANAMLDFLEKEIKMLPPVDISDLGKVKNRDDINYLKPVDLNPKHRWELEDSSIDNKEGQ